MSNSGIEMVRLNSKTRRPSIVGDEKGSTIVEFSLIAILFFSLVFAVIDLGLMFYANLTMQHAIREGVRYTITGQSDLGVNRLAALEEKIRQSSNGLYDKFPEFPAVLTTQVIDPVTSGLTNIPIPEDINDADAWEAAAGPGQIMVISVNYTWPLLTPLLKPFFPDGRYNFTVSATMSNEPFPTDSDS